MATYEVRDGLKRVQSEGDLLAESSTKRPRQHRWVTLQLYTHPPTDDYPGRYFLHVVGGSEVYHDHASDCNTGVPVASENLPRDASPCPECHPPRIRWNGQGMEPAGLTVDLEAARHKLHDCATPEDVLAHLEDPALPGSKLSNPAQTLLERAATVAPVFETLLSAVVVVKARD